MRICFPPCKSRRFSARRARFGRGEKLYCARVIRRARFGGRAEICVEHQAGNRRVVGHIVVGIVPASSAAPVLTVAPRFRFVLDPKSGTEVYPHTRVMMIDAPCDLCYNFPIKE